MGRSYTDIKYDLWYNLEKYGILPGDIALAIKGNPGGTVFSYRPKPQKGLIIGSSIKYGPNNGYTFSGNGSTDRINLGSITFSDPLSGYDSQELFILTKILDTGSTTGNAYPRIIDKSDGPSAANGWAIWREAGEIAFGFNGSAQKFLSATAHPKNKKTTVGIRLKFGLNRLWIDGVYSGYNTSSTVFSSTTTNAAIGNWNHSTDREWSGEIGTTFVLPKTPSESVIKQLSVDIDSIWKPRPDISYFDVAASGATISPIKVNAGLVNSNLTVPRLIA